MSRMSLDFSFVKRKLQFRFDAGTSRGVLREHTVYWIKAVSTDNKLIGWGEAAPLINLSPDHIPDFELRLKEMLTMVSGAIWDLEEDSILDQVEELIPFEFPSVRFGLESALLDLCHGAQRKYFKNDFFDHKKTIPINGLVWMGDKEFMLDQIKTKLEAGFDCIKMKIGAIDFEEEIRLLQYIRERFDADQITLRVDANGAFPVDEALAKLERLSALDLHSIEQPIKAGQWKEMKTLCKQTPLPIALDEELIGRSDKADLLGYINPQYIILKPTLVGGVKATKAWISEAGKLGIDWWMTSALESNIGLNVISQLASSYSPTLPQGLGTGQLYHNNLASPLTIRNGEIFYDNELSWESPED